MRGKITGYLIIGLLSIVLVALAVSALLLSNNSGMPPFDIALDTGNAAVSLWENENGVLYAFLPGGCGSSVRISTDEQVTLDGKTLENGSSLTGLSENVQHTLRWGNTEKNLVIMRGEGTPVMLLDSAQKNISELYDGKSGREVVRTTLINENGVLQLSDSASAISTRGFSTRLPDKKPYNLKLSEKQNILGMPEAKKWTLLANAYDESGIKNKLVLDFARSSGVQGTPDSRYVNLYVDGEYSGLYLLCQRINDLGTLEDCVGQVLVTESYAVRSNDDTFFCTRGNRTFELKNDSDTDAKKWALARSILQKTEDALEAGDLSGYIDIQSWCRQYLIEEVFGNSDIASLYFHIETQNEMVYAGPAWDYDNALGSSSLNRYVRSPSAFTANAENVNSFYTVIYNNESFRQRVTELYSAEYLPELKKLLQSGIDGYLAEIANSAAMDAVRRKTMYEGYTIRCSAGDIKQYLSDRIDFLQEVWIDGKTRYTITLKRPKNKSYMYLTVRPGECINLPPAKELGVTDDVVWMDEITGKPLDTSAPVNCDMSFAASGGRNSSAAPGGEMVFSAAACALLLLLLGIMISIDVLRRRKS